MRPVDFDALRAAAGIGVAGNFAGHLEQAGEAADFTNIEAATDAPKGVFPWYLPGGDTFLGVFPLSSGRIALPGDAATLNLQIEPEVAVICDVVYDGYGRVTMLEPRLAAAFNDCSIRRPGATKISEKKNWGPDSKGLAASALPLHDVDADGGLRSLRIASFLRRDGQTHPYGIDSAAAEYSYAGVQLLEWIVDRLRRQQDDPTTPLEPIGAYLEDIGLPETMVIGIGATRYTPFGESTYLEAGDEAIVVVYDGAVVGPDEIAGAVGRAEEVDLDASVLSQRVG